MAPENNNQGKPKLRLDTKMLLYVVIAILSVLTALLYLIYTRVNTPPIPIDKQVEALVKDNQYTWDAIQSIKKVVK